MKLGNSNCYGFAIGINAPIIPGTNGGAESPIEDWSDSQVERPSLIEAINQLKVSLLKDGLIGFQATENKVVAFVVKYSNGSFDFHLAESTQGQFRHKLSHVGDTHEASTLKELVDQIKSSNSNIETVYKACDVWVPEVFYWEADEMGSTFSIKLK